MIDTSSPDKNIKTVLRPLEEQRNAANPASSVWVGASAGSGKTKVLADRVLRLLLTGVEPQKILCITFTRAAAAQMSIRVTEQLSKWATCSDDELRNSLDALENAVPDVRQMARARCLFALALNCPGGLRIKTVHSFAQEILKRFPIEAGLPPHFTLLEETEQKTLRQESLDAVLRRSMSTPTSNEGQAMAVLSATFSQARFPELLHEALAHEKRFHLLLTQAGSTENVRRLLLHSMNLDEESTVLKLQTQFCQDQKDVHGSLRVMQSAFQQGTTIDQEKATFLSLWLSSSASDRVLMFDSYKKIFLTDKNEPTKRINKGVRTACPVIETLIGSEAARLLCVVEQIETVEIIDRTIALLTWVVSFADDYKSRKTARSALDFDDMIQKAKSLLSRSHMAEWVLYKLDKGLDHILLDEAQDTTPDQWDIVRILAEEFFVGQSARSDTKRTLFVVGDEKQSIYSFQGADPDSFARMRHYFKEMISSSDNALYREVPMNMSFRSAPAVLRAVDAAFANEQVRQGVSVDPVHHIPYRQDNAAGRVEVWPLIEPEKVERKKEAWALTHDNENTKKPILLLAEQTASRIDGWLRSGLWVRNRAVRPDDIMVLVRRRNTYVNALVRALKKRRIPVSGVDRMVLTDQLVVKDLLAFLQFLLLPEDDLMLATLLRGPLLGWSEEQLMALALNRKGPLIVALNNSDSEGAKKAAAYLKKWLNKVDAVTPFALLVEIIASACPGDDISGRRALWKRLGPDALDPLDELLNAASTFGVRHSPSLQAFVQEMLSVSTVIKREMEQGAGQIRIMTVHGSKGLEAPIVILPDTTAIIDINKITKWLWNEKGLPFFVSSTPMNTRLQALRWDVFEKDMEEYRRLFYVALTRAADHLYVGGWRTARSDKSGRNWYDLACQAWQGLHDETARESNSDAVICFADPLLKGEPKKDKEEPACEIPLPSWINNPAPIEPEPPQPLVPSKQEEDPSVQSPRDDKRFQRGIFIHKLLQYLPDVSKDDREAMARTYLAQAPQNLDADVCEQLIQEVMGLLNNPTFAPLFDADSRAEVPITGLWNNRVVSGQVDRLCVKADDVWIVDYKTNRPPPKRAEDVSLSYKKQLAAYRGVLSMIYPTKKVRCFLLWTYDARLMEIDI